MTCTFIFLPPVPRCRFLNMFAQLHLRLPRVPLVEGGNARVQPLFVQDLAQVRLSSGVTYGLQCVLRRFLHPFL